MTLFEWIVVVLLGLITLRLLFLETLNYSPGFSQILTKLEDINKQIGTINSGEYQARGIGSDISYISDKIHEAVVNLESIDKALFDVKDDITNITASVMEIEIKIDEIKNDVSIIEGNVG